MLQGRLQDCYGKFPDVLGWTTTPLKLNMFKTLKTITKHWHRASTILFNVNDCEALFSKPVIFHRGIGVGNIRNRGARSRQIGSERQKKHASIGASMRPLVFGVMKRTISVQKCAWTCVAACLASLILFKKASNRQIRGASLG
jgi:hypothetical protein